MPAGRSLFGSLSDGLVHSCSCDVIVVKEAATQISKHGGNKVLMACTRSPARMDSGRAGDIVHSYSSCGGSGSDGNKRPELASPDTEVPGDSCSLNLLCS